MKRFFFTAATVALCLTGWSASAQFCINGEEMHNESAVAKNTVKRFMGDGKSLIPGQFTVKLDLTNQTFLSSEDLGVGPRGELLGALMRSARFARPEIPAYFQSMCAQHALPLQKVFAALLDELTSNHVAIMCRFFGNESPVNAAEASTRLMQLSAMDVEMTCYHAGI